MSNKYGYFKYMDFANGADEDSQLSTPTELQENASLDLLKEGREFPQYQTLEQNEYVTRFPFPFYQPGYSVGFLTSQISDGNGVFKTPIVLDIQFSEYFSMTGLTIATRSVVRKAVVEGYRDGELIARGEFSAETRSHFYPIELEFVNAIKYIVYEIVDPYHFLGIYSISYGRIKDFGDQEMVSAQITSNFSVLGDNLEYDTLDLTLKSPDDIGAYIFQKKQVINFIKDENYELRMFVDNGLRNQNGTVSVTAYDSISNLEDVFLGGMYSNVPVYDIIKAICGDRIWFTFNADRTIPLTGYIPICTRRKALQMVLQAANLRCYKAHRLIFAPLETELSQQVFDKTNILGEPKIIENEPIRSVQVNYHNYSKTLEEIELYHWYIATEENVQITFSSPAHSLAAYEVTGTDNNGQDIVSTEISKNVKFVEIGANYCVLYNTSPNKIVIKGKKYSDSVASFKLNNKFVLRDEVYSDVIVDMTIHGNVEETCNIAYSQYTKKNSIKFNTLQDLKVGGLYNILGKNYYIKRKKTNLDGIYEVEAV